MGFTEDQLKAIETTDKSVLVSAAAGSGKTSVLVERIIRIILDGKANVDEMLVVTFTNAAAAEMRMRLAAAIRRRMAEHPGDTVRMKDQLARLYKSYITTIDSFALRVIREFFHETDLDPAVSVCDDVQGELLRKEAIAELFEDGFADDELIEGGSFRGFLRLYSSDRSDEAFMEDMLKAYSALRSMPDYFEWALERAGDLRVSPETFEGSALQSMMAEDGRITYERACDALRRLRALFDEAGLSSMYENKLKEQADAVFGICGMLSEGRLDAEVIAAMEAIPSTRLAAKKDEKEAYETIKADVKVLRDAFKKELDGFAARYLTPDFETRLAETAATYEYTVYYIRLLMEFEKRYESKKRERKLMDFADMEHYAVRILRSDEAAEALRRRFRYIFVDEYQDTNHIQEHLISRIARPDNVFRVGDLKQSIYGFRQAEPGIFAGLYERYSRVEERDGVVIDLGYNFRTNEKTIDYVNHVFKHIMEGYDERALLRFGQSSYRSEYDFIPEVHVLFEDEGDAGGAEAEPETAPDADIIDDEIEDLSKEEAEAEYIAGLVDGIIGTEFYDSKAGVVRKAGAKDITILLRAVKYRGEIMSRALRERAVESHIEESDDYFDTVEVSIALALLTCIDNMKRDVPLIAVLHSEVFGFSPDELAEIRIARGGRGPYWEAFAHYADEGPEGLLRDKVAAARDRMLEWRSLSRMLPLADFVWKVLVDSGYYRMAGAMAGGARRQANLRSLADRAADFSREGVASLSSFITFLDMMRVKGISNGQAPMAGKDDDVVRISTIHKSKGLEYPFVIVGGLGHRFRTDSNEKKFSFDSSIGVGMPYIDPSRKFWRSTMVQRAINSAKNRDEYSEELRLLYVAMTRARNKLILVGSAKSEEDLAKYTSRPQNFLKAMREVLKTDHNKYYASPLMLSRRSARNGAAGIRSYLDKPLTAEEQSLYDEIDRRFTYSYPDEELLSAKAKYSVSAIRREENEILRGAQDDSSSEADDNGDESDVTVTQADTEVVKLWDMTERRRKASSADTGIAYHRIMEFLDFGKVTDADGIIDEAYILERADFLHDHGAIKDEVYRDLDLTRIAAFFASGIGQRAVAAAARGVLRREKPFTLRTVRSGREMLVQGVIDCCFEENGRMVLIDYKSNFIHPGRDHASEIARIRDEYRVQIELYSEALRKGSGMDVAEAYLYLFATGEALDML